MIAFNGMSDTSLSYHLTDLSGWLDGPSTARNLGALLGVYGSAPSQYASVKARTINMRGRLQCTSLTDRKDKLSALFDATTNAVELVFDDSLTRYVIAQRESFVVTERAPQAHLNLMDVFVSMTFTAYDVASYDLEPSLIAFDSTPVPVVIGTLPTPGIFHITGALSATVSRTITYRSFNGIAYGTLTLTPPSGESLGANDYLIVSLSHPGTIIKVAAGVRSDVYHWKSAGAWFMPSPEDCDRQRSVYPTLEINSGAATFIYTNAWAL